MSVVNVSLDPLAGTAEIAKLLVEILPSVIASAKEARFTPNCHKIFVDLKKSEAELKRMSEAQKRQFSKRLENIYELVKRCVSPHF